MKTLLHILLFVAVVVGGVVAILGYFFFQVAVVGHDGMAPTAIAGEKIIITRGVSEANMGDILLCPSKSNPSVFLFGRVFGKPGMRTQITNGTPEVSGTKASQDRIAALEFTDNRGVKHQAQAAWETMGNARYLILEPQQVEPEMRPVDVEGGVFLLGDNRIESLADSRRLGTVDPSTCIGKAMFRLQSAEGRDFENEELARGFLDILH